MQAVTVGCLPWSPVLSRGVDGAPIRSLSVLESLAREPAAVALRDVVVARVVVAAHVIVPAEAERRVPARRIDRLAAHA